MDEVIHLCIYVNDLVTFPFFHFMFFFFCYASNEWRIKVSIVCNGSFYRQLAAVQKSSVTMHIVDIRLLSVDCLRVLGTWRPMNAPDVDTEELGSETSSQQVSDMIADTASTL